MTRTEILGEGRCMNDGVGFACFHNEMVRIQPLKMDILAAISLLLLKLEDSCVSMDKSEFALQRKHWKD